MGRLYLWAFFFVIINPFVTKKGYKYYLCAILAVLCYFAFHLKITESMDLYRSIGNMQLYAEMGWGWVVANRMDNNPLATVLFFVFGQFENPMWLPTFTAFICYGSAFSLILKCAKRYDLSKGQMNCLLVFFCLNFYYDQAITNIKIYLCYALISYFMYYELMEHRFKKTAWVVYIASCFLHYAAVPFLLFRMVLSLRRKLKDSEFVFLGIVFVAVLFSGYIIPRLGSLGGVLGTLASKNEGYQDYQVFGIWQFISSVTRTFCFSGLFIYMYRRCKEDEQQILFYLGCICIMLIGMMNQYQLIHRTPNFIHYLGMLPLCRFMKQPMNMGRREGMIHSGLALCLVMVTAFTIFYQVMWIFPSVGFEF